MPRGTTLSSTAGIPAGQGCPDSWPDSRDHPGKNRMLGLRLRTEGLEPGEDWKHIGRPKRWRRTVTTPVRMKNEDNPTKPGCNWKILGAHGVRRCRPVEIRSGAATGSIKIRGIQPPLTRDGRDGSVRGTKAALGVAPGCPVSRGVSGGLSTNIRTEEDVGGGNLHQWH